MENLVRGLPVSSESKLPGAKVHIVKSQVIVVALFLVIPILLTEASILPCYRRQKL